MRVLAAILPLLAVVSAAHSSHGRHRRHARAVEQPHANIARSNEAHAQAVRVIKRKVRQRGQTCRPRVADAQAHVAVGPSSSSTSSASSTSPSSWAEPTYSATSATWSAEPSYAAESAPPAPSPPAPSPPAPAPAPDQQYGTNDGNCGWSNAGPDAPNGSEDWLNCGVEGGGWTPPFLGLGDIKAAPLSADGIFAPCAPYFWAFEQYGGEFGIPPIMLASFAMQESTCNPSVTGGGGEAGMMQIAPPNCEQGQNCWDINYNVRRGAQLFSQKIASAGGNVVQAIGAYNGWQPGMTTGSAMAPKWEGRCFQSNNLDYLHQWLNGWIQGKDGHTLGKYFNLRDC